VDEVPAIAGREAGDSGQRRGGTEQSTQAGKRAAHLQPCSTATPLAGAGESNRRWFALMPEVLAADLLEGMCSLTLAFMPCMQIIHSEETVGQPKVSSALKACNR